MTTRQKVVLAVAAGRAVARARVAGKKAAKRLIIAADAALVAQGKAARARQRKRAMKATRKRVEHKVARARNAAATVVAVRATRRAVRRRTIETA